MSVADSASRHPSIRSSNRLTGRPAREPDHAPQLERLFQLEPTECAYRIEEIEGSVPAAIRGTYYLNGPALFTRNGQRHRNWLDGDGMVSALRFSSSGVRLTSRFVRTTKFRQEETAGRFLYRAFGSAFTGDRLKGDLGLESPANVSVYPWDGRLIAFGEQGLPWELDPETLETRGQDSFGGRLNRLSPLAAHPNFDQSRGEMFNFGVSFSVKRPSLQLYRFALGNRLVYRRRLALEHPLSVHDFGLSPRYAVFHLGPYVLDTTTFLEQGTCLLDALKWRPELGTRLLVADRESGREVASVEIGSGYCLHMISCFESRGYLVVDVLELDRPVYDQYEIPELFRDAASAQPVRYIVDLDSGRGRLVERSGLAFYRMCDFPAIDPRRAGSDYRDFWVLGISASREPGRKFFDQLVHLDWRTGCCSSFQTGSGRYLGGEPVFLPDPGNPHGGWILCQEFDAESRAGAFLLFDAFDVLAGPVARLRLREPRALGFHACWAPDEIR